MENTTNRLIGETHSYSVSIQTETLESGIASHKVKIEAREKKMDVLYGSEATSLARLLLIAANEAENECIANYRQWKQANEAPQLIAA